MCFAFLIIYIKNSLSVHGSAFIIMKFQRVKEHSFFFFPLGGTSMIYLC